MKHTKNKAALQNEVTELISEVRKKKELRSVSLILTYNGMIKLDRYSLNLGGPYNERYGFSMPTITEKEAAGIIKDEPTAYIILFHDGRKSIPRWLRGVSSVLNVPLDELKRNQVKAFFNYEYPVLTFPKSIYSDKDLDAGINWTGSNERKLWKEVTRLWHERLDNYPTKNQS